jgi:hypothetical protein
VTRLRAGGPRNWGSICVRNKRCGVQQPERALPHGACVQSPTRLHGVGATLPAAETVADCTSGPRIGQSRTRAAQSGGGGGGGITWGRAAGPLC